MKLDDQTGLLFSRSDSEVKSTRFAIEERQRWREEERVIPFELLHAIKIALEQPNKVFLT